MWTLDRLKILGLALQETRFLGADLIEVSRYY